MKTLALVVMLFVTGCMVDADDVDEVDAGLSEPVYLVTTLGLSGPCATDDRFPPPEIISIAPRDGMARVTLDFGEVVEVQWKVAKDGTTVMGGTPFTSTTSALLGGVFSNGSGQVRWDGPLGVCTQSVEIARSH